jgi:hypothetical protein
MTARTRDLAVSITSFGTLVLLACFVYARLFEMQPFSGDNVRILFWADGASAASLLRGDPAVYPEWRPLAYLTVWLQYRWFQIDHLHAYYVINLLLWTGCAWLVCHIVRRLTHSSVPALLAAAVVVTDTRAVAATIGFLERATSMACLFGLMALLIIISARDQRLPRLRWIGLSLLLLASGLSKEYGLAFTGAVAVSALVERRRDVATAAIAAGVTYALLRIGFAGGAMARYCDEMGYFFALRQVCFDGVHAEVVKQAAYNVAATGVGSILPGVFAEWGEIGIAPRQVAASVVWLAAAAIGWSKSPTPMMRITLLVVAFNAALSFMLYTDRNHLVALCALGIAEGVGLAVAHAAVQASAWPRLIRGTAAMGLLVLLGAQAIATREIMSGEVADSRREDPCAALAQGRPLDPAFVKKIKTAYGIPNPGCMPGR